MAKLQIFFPDGSEITHDLPEEKTSVGRIAENQLHIPDDSVSSRHAEILFENANFYVRDLDSTNGTFINGSKTESAVLKHGDEVRFGSVACLFISENADSAAAPEAAAIEEQQPSSKSVRPENFTSCSPIPRNKNGKDFSPLAVAAAALIGTAATAAALYFIFQPPV
jgi:pSer/pThr/pTyr-binding forkhead associated (FHA) protein